MLYDTTMRSIQRLEDTLACAWEVYAVAEIHRMEIPDFETLDFEGSHTMSHNKLSDCEPIRMTAAESSLDRLTTVHHRTKPGLRLPGESNPEIKCACGCGTSLKRFDSVNRPRLFVSGHNLRRSNG